MTGLHSHGLCTASASTFSVAIRGMTMPCSSSLCLSKLPNREAQHGRLPTFCSMVTNLDQPLDHINQLFSGY